MEQHIQWFPGHMTKAVRMMEDSVGMCDGVIYVLDARAAFACCNSLLDKLFGTKPVLYVLNKADTVESAEVKKLVSAFAEKGKRALPLNGTDSKSCGKLVNELKSILEEKRKRNEARGYNRDFRIMVAGIPNTGKSTIINSLCGAKRTQTGNKAGVTRGKQWVRVNGLDLLDTPGTMQPRLDNQTFATHLALIGSINDEILDIFSLSLMLIGILSERYPEALKAKYKLTEIDSPDKTLSNICISRGFLIAGGQLDTERGAKAVIDDFRKGRIGKIILEPARNSD